MRILLFFLLFITLFLPAHTQILREKVARRTEQAALEQTRKTEIKKSLQLPVFSRSYYTGWDGFLIENAVLQVPDGPESVNILCQNLFDSDCELFTSLFLGKQQWQYSLPDYAQETAGVKYIYLTDSSGHGTKTIPAEVTALLKQIRRARPQARILLALEFAERRDIHALPLHFAGETPWPFVIDPDYAPLIKTADKLNIDVLGLDDYIPDVQKELSFKMGNTFVQDLNHPNALSVLDQYQPQLSNQIAGYEELSAQQAQEIEDLQQVLSRWGKHPENIMPQLTSNQSQKAEEQLRHRLTRLQEKQQQLKQQIQELNLKKILYLHDFVSRTPWGQEQRNAQWAAYIKAVSPFYDVIITYAGNAHLSLPLTGATLLPKRLAEPFVLFDFYTQEQLKTEDAQAYEQYDQIQSRENPANGWWEEIEEDEMTQYCIQYNAQPLSEPNDLSQPFVIKTTYPSAQSAAGQDPQRSAILKKYHADLEFAVPHTDFSVFLPDRSRRCIFR